MNPTWKAAREDVRETGVYTESKHLRHGAQWVPGLLVISTTTLRINIIRRCVV